MDEDTHAVCLFPGSGLQAHLSISCSVGLAVFSLYFPILPSQMPTLRSSRWKTLAGASEQEGREREAFLPVLAPVHMGQQQGMGAPTASGSPQRSQHQPPCILSEVCDHPCGAPHLHGAPSPERSKPQLCGAPPGSAEVLVAQPFPSASTAPALVAPTAPPSGLL